jgi:phosphoribosylanthranilate isomerase
MRVKLCGMTDAAARNDAVDAGADAVGLVCDVSVDTPREIPPERAANLAASTPPFVTTTLVTMLETVAETVDLVDRVRPDVLQVHAAGPADVATLASDTRTRIVAAVGLDADLSAYADAADALLLDSTDDAGAGGTGRIHDWKRSRAVVDALDCPVVLAGGLTPENVAEGVATVRPYAVDVASGIESAPGEKDPEAMRTFVEAARGAT